MIRNPILPGFNPDPSICRVGDDYFIATSTFEWFPGVQIHRSTDLVNWELACRPLTRASQLDMRGNPDSCGVWAPCLSHADGLFWLVYTDVKRLDGNFKDAHNYIVTAPAIDGPWSDPVYVNSSGFDPSLFHDDDGRKWFLNMQWNHCGRSVGGRPRSPAFDGILMQEWHPEHGLTGPVHNIFAGSSIGLVEGPHLFKRKGYYYLTTAEGGTGYGHAVTMARARQIDGPYTLHPDTHLITSRDHPDAPLQRAGHGQIVETPQGDVYHTHLCSRPLPGRFSPLGRETAIQKCIWADDDWLYLAHGGPVPALDVAAPTEVEPRPAAAIRRVFDGPDLPPEFQWLRSPQPERLFTLTGDALRLHARESIGSWFEQSLVARRQEHLHYSAETELAEFTPDTYQQAAGLVTYYNRSKFHFAAVTWDKTLGRCLTIMSCNGDWPDGALSWPCEPVALAPGPVWLSVQVSGAVQQFHWHQGGTTSPLGPALDASVISDEGGRGEHGSFTGAFVGMMAFDITGRALPAHFRSFDYTPEPGRA
ncbi:glycoside hydrolase family 43 protein [Roseinatronobacter alkalisoli]|uniref:Glycoside hydrolase family 43 protein n=1 Tax=Roseinatronobacter alkalisoli TaxID=3028235 RepID=A0ABT5TAQ6_9RHOB|nr:glycoside hydrolase family 43 protein [Roseinatronobacter sp. HJB301]MDD7972208.1 glycoside hydrolase family 43 protein [Roseinatronobacter sp. HJB301]